jgi:hypothetical protein
MCGAESTERCKSEAPSSISLLRISFKSFNLDKRKPPLKMIYILGIDPIAVL